MADFDRGERRWGVIVDVVYAEDGFHTRRVVERGSCWVVGWWFKADFAYKKYAWTVKGPFTGKASCVREVVRQDPDRIDWGTVDQAPVAVCERVLGRWWEESEA